ncbi:BA14K family protein [Bradyrhizobium canariense]|uniref:BA14K family protein n=1 Tax=Bradyrhizobium canariense TaxID=255045 RepID=UPI0011BAD84D|nr:BA14K family protein [Bradyrhizobium canariense]
MPIGLTASGEVVFPFHCKEFLERQKAANQKNAEENQKPTAADKKPAAGEQKTVAKPSAATEKPATAEVKPATAERKPAAVEEKPAAVEEKTVAKQPESVLPENSKPATETVGTISLPKRVEREARERMGPWPGCTHFQSYNPVSRTYTTYDGQRRQCREVTSTTTATRAGPPASGIPLPPGSSKAPPQSAGGAAAVDSNTTPANIAGSRSTVGAASSNARTIEAQVAAATILAEHLTVAAAAPPPDMKGNNTDTPRHAETSTRGSAEKTASASANNTDLLVAVLMARPEITSVAGLTGKTIAIDDRYSASNGSIRNAIVAAGAPAIELSEGQTRAISRLVNGEVPAAILTLVSADAAERFPEIAGFKILRIPLSPRS